MAPRLAFEGYQQLTLLPVIAVAGAVTAVVTTPVIGLLAAQAATFQATFLYGAGGTTVKAWIQTTFNGGISWMDIANFAFTTAAATRLHSVRATTAVAANITPLDGTMADNAILDGILGSQLRVKYTSTGTYTGATSLAVYAVTKGS